MCKCAYACAYVHMYVFYSNHCRDRCAKKSMTDSLVIWPRGRSHILSL